MANAFVAKLRLFLSLSPSLSPLMANIDVAY